MTDWNDAIEAAAKVCEQHPEAGMSASRTRFAAGMECAKAIRKLKRPVVHAASAARPEDDPTDTGWES